MWSNNIKIGITFTEIGKIGGTKHLESVSSSLFLVQANHSQLLLPEEDSKEMDRLKNHIDTLLDEQEKKRPASASQDGTY